MPKKFGKKSMALDGNPDLTEAKKDILDTFNHFNEQGFEGDQTKICVFWKTIKTLAKEFGR